MKKFLETAKDAAALLEKVAKELDEGTIDPSKASAFSKLVTNRVNMAKLEILEKARIGDDLPAMWLWDDSTGMSPEQITDTIKNSAKGLRIKSGLVSKLI